MRWILAKALDHACVPSRLSPFIISRSFSSAYLLLPPTLLCIRFSFSVLFPSFLDFRRSSISAFSISVSVFLVSSFIALASVILRSRFRYPVVFISSPSSTRFFPSFRSRHPYNMSPIVTFLVSGLLLLFGVTSPSSWGS